MYIHLSRKNNFSLRAPAGLLLTCLLVLVQCVLDSNDKGSIHLIADNIIGKAEQLSVWIVELS